MITKRPLSPFALSLSKGFSFLKRSKGLRQAQPERKRGLIL